MSGLVPSEKRPAPGNRSLLAIERVQEAFIVLLVAMLFVLLFFQIVSRTLLDSPPVWTEEIARLTMVWLTFVSAGVVAGKGAHITITAVTDRLGKRVSRVLERLAELITLGASIALLPTGFELTRRLASVSSSSAGVSRGWLFAAGLVGFTLIAVHTSIRLFFALAAGRTPPEPSGPGDTSSVEGSP